MQVLRERNPYKIDVMGLQIRIRPDTASLNISFDPLTKQFVSITKRHIGTREFQLDK